MWHTNWHQKENTNIVLPRKQYTPGKVNSYQAWNRLTWTLHWHNGANLLKILILTWNSSPYLDSILNFQPMLKSLVLLIIKNSIATTWHESTGTCPYHWPSLIWPAWNQGFLCRCCNGNYCCFKLFIPSTGGVRIAYTVRWFPHGSLKLPISSKD